MSEGIVERVVELLNDAILASNDKAKVNNLRKVQELVVSNDLLDSFLDEILSFQNDSMVEVRKFVAGFIEASCNKDPEFFPKLIVNLSSALNDSSPHVVKKSIQVATLLYKKFLQWTIKASTNENVESTSEVWVNMKRYIFQLLEVSENDGIRTHCIKFMEMIVILQTPRDQWSNPNEMSLDMLKNCKFLNINQLEEEANQVFEQLIIFHGTSHISSINLMATMQSLVNLARQRSALFLSKVIQALEALHANLPPTLAKSQVTSVRKHLKVHLALLLKHPAAATNVNYQSQVIQLLNDLGTTQSEIYKCLQEVRKRGIKVEPVSIEPKPKRIKLEADEPAKEKSEILPPPKVTRNDANMAIDITADDLTPCLNSIANVCDLVLVSLLSLPDTMPSYFQASYTPVAAAGTSSQIKHLARLISTQLTAAGIGKGVDEMVTRAASANRYRKAQSAEQNQQQFQKIAAIVSRSIAQEVRKQEQQNANISKNQQQNKLKLLTAGKPLSGPVKVKQINFAEMVKPISDDEKVRMIALVVGKILQSQWPDSYLSHTKAREEILTLLATQLHDHPFNSSLLVLSYAFEDLPNRVKVLFNLIYSEFLETSLSGGDYGHYDKCVSSIFNQIIEKASSTDCDKYLPQLFLEAPLITLEMVNTLKNYILRDTHCCDIGFSILQTLLEKRKSNRPQLLDLLMNLSIHQDKPELRANSIKTIRYLYERYPSADIRPPIEKFTSDSLHRLLEQAPFHDQASIPWSEEVIKIFLLPYLSLLPYNHRLIHELAVVYVSTNPDIKRVILRVLDAPVKGMGMNSPELLLLVETCPKGAETLVTRIIHVLTDKQPPSAELVSRVRDLYQKRVPDVRFLIPVLNGLTKNEVIAALPKLIKLNPIVVKEVFNRLLGSQAIESGQKYQSPLTEADLLVALHNIDPSKCDMKTVMKAISLCFSEKHIYTAEVLAIVMQLLMDQNPLPTLLMRTVIQSLSLYPRLIGFVMNILQRLILKQVWKEKKVWEGFIKCCQRTKPHSFQVLLQLPAPQLLTVFRACPDFKTSLQQHVSTLTETQRSHIPASILEVIFSPDQPSREEPMTSMETNEVDYDNQNSPLQLPENGSAMVES